MYLNRAGIALGDANSVLFHFAPLLRARCSSSFCRLYALHRLDIIANRAHRGEGKLANDIYRPGWDVRRILGASQFSKMEFSDRRVDLTGQIVYLGEGRGGWKT